MRAPARTTSPLERLAWSVLAVVLCTASCRDESPVGRAPAASPSTGSFGGEHEGCDQAMSGASAGPEVGGDRSAIGGAEPGGEEPTPEEPVVVGPRPDEPEPEKPEPEKPEPEKPEPGAGGSGGGGPGEDAAGLPCDVQRLLRARCQSCHSSTPVEGAAIPLVTYDDLTARSKNDASVTVLARCLKRMKDTLRPMPPSPANAITVSEMTPLQAWLEAGAPRGECEETPGRDPYEASPVCTSGSYWTAIDSGSPWMNPGIACIKCHRQSPSFAPLFTVAGTVFPSAHEPDKCFGVPLSTGAQVIITDANGQELAPIRVVSGGNFGAILSGLALPYRAKVVVGGEERAMLTPQTNGDCNACHTQAGTQGARGRIIPP